MATEEHVVRCRSAAAKMIQLFLIDICTIMVIIIYDAQQTSGRREKSKSYRYK